MPVEQIGHQRDSVGGGNIWQTNNARVGGTEKLNQRAEVTVDRYQNAPFLCRCVQQGRIAWVRLLLPGGSHAVPLGFEPGRQSLAGTAINQKLHT